MDTEIKAGLEDHRDLSGGRRDLKKTINYKKINEDTSFVFKGKEGLGWL